MPSVCVPVLSPVLPLSPVTVLPCQLGAESDRAPCPAPFTCHCHLSTHNIPRFFPSPMQEVCPPSRITFSFWSVAPFLFGLLPCTPPRLYSSVCPSCPPTLSHLSNASFFFFAILHPKVSLLGSAGGSKPCFWPSPVLTFEGTTPLSSPSYPSLTPPPP